MVRVRNQTEDNSCHVTSSVQRLDLLEFYLVKLMLTLVEDQGVINMFNDTNLISDLKTSSFSLHLRTSCYFQIYKCGHRPLDPTVHHS